MTFARRTSALVDLTGSPPVVGAAITDIGEVEFTAMTVAWTSADLIVDAFSELLIDVTATTTTTNWKYVLNRKGADGSYYPIATSATHTDSGKTVSLSVGAGMAPGPSASGAGVVDAATGNTNWTAPFGFGDVVQIVLTPTGAFTGTLSVKGK